MKTQSLLEAAGSLREHYARVDWAAGSLGAPEDWPVELGSAVRLMLGSNFPMTLLWGPELVRLYNAPYTALVGDKHPAALGRPTREMFPELWSTIGPMITGVMAGEGGVWSENRLLQMERHGFLEDCYFTFSYSPVEDEAGVVRGVAGIVTETTAEVIALRRFELLAALGGTLGDLEDGADLAGRAVALLRQYPDDLPAVDIRRSLDGGAGPDGAALPERPGVPISMITEVVVEDTPSGRVAWVPLLTSGSASDPAFLVAALNPRLVVDEAYVLFLRLVGVTLSQSFGRVEVLAAERLVASTERAISESLQLSLLTPPVPTHGVEMAARYVPAVSAAKIGGDWYDTFHGPDGALHVVLGDVAGHDRQAAVMMAQARNVMRGVAYALDLSPARTMDAFDRAISGLDDDALLTAILARAVFADEDAGSLRLTWTNAGHPPPILVPPDGPAYVLDQAHEALVGAEAFTPRSEHTEALPPGSTVVLYTDGLIERRGELIDQGVERLVHALDGSADLSPDEVADRLVADLGHGEEDDVAVLVLRVTG